MTAQEYPAQLPTYSIGSDEGPGDAPESPTGLETGPPGMPLMDPTSTTVAGAVGNAMDLHGMMAGTTMGIGGHVGVNLPNMPDAQMSPAMNAIMGTPESGADALTPMNELPGGM